VTEFEDFGEVLFFVLMDWLFDIDNHTNAELKFNLTKGKFIL